MLQADRSSFFVAPKFQPLMRELGLDADTVFDHPDIKPWRTLADRENCTLDAINDGRPIRLHIKRYQPARGFATPAELEVQAIKALSIEQISTLTLVAWGRIADGRSFVITEDLAGFHPCDKLIEKGLPFEMLLEPTADLAARLHSRGLHHRDLYLCHFFYKSNLKEEAGGDVTQVSPSELRLIDVARVRRLPGWPLRSRWIYKDLGQFWYSTLALAVSGEQRARWLARYAAQRGLASADALRARVERVAKRIARHDAKLKLKQPNRNISIPQEN